MASEPVVDEFDQYRAQRLKLELEKIKTVALIEQPADKIYSLEIQGRVFRYQRWTHDQLNRWSQFLKAHPGKQFSGKDEIEFKAIELELITAATLDKDTWRDFLNNPENEKLVHGIWFAMMHDSLSTTQFAENLKEFFATDYGYIYGYYWFIIAGKMPHEIGQMPDSSVHAINSWLAQWAGKVIRK